MRSLTTAAKAQITRDWLQQFPSLALHQALHLLRRVGPILQGVVLERTSSNDSYRPTFHVHCLARAFPVVTMTLSHQLRSERSGGPDSIQVSRHEAKFAQAAARLRHQSPLALEGNLNLEGVIGAYRSFVNRPGAHFDAHNLYQDMALICAWAGKSKQAHALVQDGTKSMEHWPSSVLEQMGGLQPWREQLTEAISNQGHVCMTVDEQAELLGVAGLPSADLIAT